MGIVRIRLTASAFLLAGVLPLLASCSSAVGEQASTMTASNPAATASPSPGASTPAPDDDTDVAVGPGAALPDSWPDALPALDGGELASVVVADDGANINAAWTTDASLADAFATMDEALKSNGFATYKDAGREDMYIATEDMLSDNYETTEFDVNLTVALNGGQTTVLLNASRIQ